MERGRQLALPGIDSSAAVDAVGAGDVVEEQR